MHEPHPAVAAGDVAAIEVYYEIDGRLRIVLCPSVTPRASEILAAIAKMVSHGHVKEAAVLLDEAVLWLGEDCNEEPRPCS